MRLAALAVIATLATLSAASPAAATFPGGNGRIYFTVADGAANGVWSVEPGGAGLTRIVSPAEADGASGFRGIGVSPDGSQVVFSATVGDDDELFLTSALGFHTRRLTDNAIADQHPAFDSERIPGRTPNAYRVLHTRNAPGCDGEIASLDPDGDGLETLIAVFDVCQNEGSGDIDASADGRFIAFVADDNEESADTVIERLDRADGVVVFPPLTDDDIDRRPEFAPSANRLWFQRANSCALIEFCPGFDLASMHPSGADEDRETDTDDDSEYAPAPSPDGTDVAFGAGGLAVRFDGGDRTIVVARERIGNGLVGDVEWQAVEPPQTTLTTKPPSQSGSETAVFGFRADERTTRFTCSFDGGPVRDCGNSQRGDVTGFEVLDGLTDGVHTFAVGAVDLTGRADPTPATHTFTVETGSPPPGGGDPPPDGDPPPGDDDPPPPGDGPPPDGGDPPPPGGGDGDAGDSPGRPGIPSGVVPCPAGTSPSVTCRRDGRGRLHFRGTGLDETMIGSNEIDVFRAGPGRDAIHGRRGDDRVRADRGRDRLAGGPGRDRLRGNRGADRLRGNRGRDRYSGGAGNDRIDSARQRGEPVRCGRGRRDRVVGARGDRIATDCERVRRR